MKNIISAKWLNNNIENKNLVIIDCRFDLMNKEYGKVSYEKEHIKGALYIDIEHQLANSVKEHGGRHPLPSVKDLKNTFESVGISNNSIIVCYDDGDLAGPSRLWWILKYLGHNSVYILEGGINEYKKIGGKVTADIEKIDRGSFQIKINENLKVDMDYVRQRINDSNVAIVDSRENKRYIGEFEPVDIKSGHIPGATNYFWMDIFNKEKDELVLKDIQELKYHFSKLKDYKEIIIYCGSGITACCNSLMLNELDINNKVYLGSFSDWISYEENEVITGK